MCMCWKWLMLDVSGSFVRDANNSKTKPITDNKCDPLSREFRSVEHTTSQKGRNLDPTEVGDLRAN